MSEEVSVLVGGGHCNVCDSPCAADRLYHPECEEKMVLQSRETLQSAILAFAAGDFSSLTTTQMNHVDDLVASLTFALDEWSLCQSTVLRVEAERDKLRAELQEKPKVIRAAIREWVLADLRARKYGWAATYTKEDDRYVAGAMEALSLIIKDYEEGE